MPTHQIIIEKRAENDSGVVKSILMTISAEYELQDNTPQSDVPNTTISLRENRRIGFGLGPREAGDLIVVDFNMLGENSVEFAKIYQSAMNQLSTMFQGRTAIPGASEFLPIPRVRKA